MDISFCKESEAGDEACRPDEPARRVLKWPRSYIAAGTLGGQQLRTIPGHFERGVLVAVVRGRGTGWKVHIAYACCRRYPYMVGCVLTASLLHVPRSEVVSGRARACPGYPALHLGSLGMPCIWEPEIPPSLWAAKSGQSWLQSNFSGQYCRGQPLCQGLPLISSLTGPKLSAKKVMGVRSPYYLTCKRL